MWFSGYFIDADGLWSFAIWAVIVGYTVYEWTVVVCNDNYDDVLWLHMYKYSTA